MKNKIICLFLVIVLAFFIGGYEFVAKADSCTKSGDPCTMSDGSAGQCISWGSSIFGCSTLVSTPVPDVGSGYEAAPEGYNPGDCPDPSKEYRDASGNCVPYDDPSYSGAAPTGYDPTGSGVDSYGNRPGFDCTSGVCYPTSTGLPDPSGGILTIITNLLNWMLGIFGILAVIAFVISGAQYILSAGSEEMIDNAKRHMKWSIVGVVVALSGLIIIFAINYALLASTTTF